MPAGAIALGKLGTLKHPRNGPKPIACFRTPRYAHPSMGTWGANLFDDDTACDVRGDWKEIYAGCDTPEEATAIMLDTWGDHLDDPDDGPVIYLAIASLQHQFGCPDSTIKARAMEIIDRGEGLQTWAEAGPEHLQARIRMYARLRKKLDAPPPALKQVRRRPLERTTLVPGQLVKFELFNDFTLIWVSALGKHMGGIVPECVFFNWRGAELPDREQILALPPYQDNHDKFNINYFQEVFKADGTYDQIVAAGYSRYLLIDSHKREYPAHRVTVLDGTYDFGLPPQPYGPTLMSWSDLVRHSRRLQAGGSPDS